MRPEKSGQVDQPEENEQLWNVAFGNEVFDSFFAQYLVGLGEFEIGNYAEHPAAALNLIFFIFATLFTQIIFMNMLIAIMGETYGRVSAIAENS